MCKNKRVAAVYRLLSWNRLSDCLKVTTVRLVDCTATDIIPNNYVFGQLYRRFTTGLLDNSVKL